MAGTVVKVWLEGAWAPEGRPVPYALVETSFRDFAAFLEAVAADEVICADKLFTHWAPGERGVRVIRDRQVMAFRGSAVRVAELPEYRVVDLAE